MITPKSIKREDSAILVEWQDGVLSKISADSLRKACPCAECREKRGEGAHSKPIGSPKKSSLRVVKHTAQESLSIVALAPVGNYALSIAWKDGHSSGIYPFSLLKTLSECA
jgi:DUF971 family protein